MLHFLLLPPSFLKTSHTHNIFLTLFTGRTGGFQLNILCGGEGEKLRGHMNYTAGLFPHSPLGGRDKSEFKGPNFTTVPRLL